MIIYFNFLLLILGEIFQLFKLNKLLTVGPNRDLPIVSASVYSKQI